MLATAAVVIFICSGTVPVEQCNETSALQILNYPDDTDESDLEKCRNVTAWVAQMAIRPHAEGEYIKWRCRIGAPDSKPETPK